MVVDVGTLFSLALLCTIVDVSSSLKPWTW